MKNFEPVDMFSSQNSNRSIVELFQVSIKIFYRKLSQIVKDFERIIYYSHIISQNSLSFTQQPCQMQGCRFPVPLPGTRNPVWVPFSGIGVSGFPFLSVSLPKEPGTRLKNRFCVFLNAQISGYNLSSILEQVTTGSRVPESGNPQWVPGSWERGTRGGLGSRILGFLRTENPLGFQVTSSPVCGFLKRGTRNPQQILRSWVLRNGNPPGFRVSGNGNLQRVPSFLGTKRETDTPIYCPEPNRNRGSGSG